MKYEIEVDRNLYHLQEVLFDLDNYSFDSDILKLLNELTTLVNNKIFSGQPEANGILDKKIKITLNSK